MELAQQLIMEGQVVIQTTTSITNIPTFDQVCRFADALWQQYMDSEEGPAHYPAFIFRAEVMAKRAKCNIFILVRMPFKSAIGDNALWEDLTSAYPKDGMQLALRRSVELEVLE